MHRQTRKLVAPVLITVLLVAYLGWIVIAGLATPGLFSDKLIVLIVLVGLIGAMLYVLVERIREIRSGEEDDLSKY